MKELIETFRTVLVSLFFLNAIKSYILTKLASESRKQIEATLLK